MIWEEVGRCSVCRHRRSFLKPKQVPSWVTQLEAVLSLTYLGTNTVLHSGPFNLKQSQLNLSWKQYSAGLSESFNLKQSVLVQIRLELILKPIQRSSSAEQVHPTQICLIRPKNIFSSDSSILARIASPWPAQCWYPVTPHICNFFYTSRIFESQNFMPENYEKHQKFPPSKKV